MVDSLVRGAALGLVPIVIWVLVGEHRRRALFARPRRRRRSIALVLSLVVIGVVVAQPWSDDEPRLDSEEEWQPLATFLGPDVPLPEELDAVEVRGDVTTSQTRRLIESAVGTYDEGKTFYRDAAEAAADLELRQPEEGETVVLLVADRHDNIGMDRGRPRGRRRGRCEAVFDAGDDTSTGKHLGGVLARLAGRGLRRRAVRRQQVGGRPATTTTAPSSATTSPTTAGPCSTARRSTVRPGPGCSGWTTRARAGSGAGATRAGSASTRSADRLADAACQADEDGERITTILVHDANMGDAALERGCTDLVVGGHLHVQSGPTEVTGENGAVGYSYTTGTTGGAAYAIAVGAAIRRPAGITLLTYRDGHPVGVQPVTLDTNGVFTVGDYVELDPSEADVEG